MNFIHTIGKETEALGTSGLLIELFSSSRS